MNKAMLGVLLLVIAGFAYLITNSTIDAQQWNYTAAGGPGGRGYERGNPPESVPINLTAGDGLSEEEKEAILYMREEEKLARDVYLALYERWKLPIFNNIARSEQRHMDMVKALIDRYGLEDPALDREAFTNQELQKLYDELVSRGQTSIEEALKVGALIEEVVIKDIKDWLQVVDKADVKMVFNNLMLGSENHLRAFTSTLKSYGVDYQPQVLTLEEYRRIIESGGWRGGFGGHGRGPSHGKGPNH